jgi:hypothetical protein
MLFPTVALAALLPALVTSSPLEARAHKKPTKSKTADSADTNGFVTVNGTGPFDLQQVQGVTFEPDLDLKAKAKTPGATLTKIRYGPYKVLLTAEVNTLFDGTLSDLTMSGLCTRHHQRQAFFHHG